MRESIPAEAYPPPLVRNDVGRGGSIRIDGGTSLEIELHASVPLVTAIRAVDPALSGESLFAVGDRLEAIGGDAERFQIVVGALGSATAERDVVFVRAALVAVAGEFDRSILLLLDAVGVVLELVACVAAQLRTVERKVDRLQATFGARLHDAFAVLARLVGGAIGVGRTLLVGYALATFANLSLRTFVVGAAFRPTAVVAADLRARTIGVTLAVSGNRLAGAPTTLLPRVTVAILAAFLAPTVDTVQLALLLPLLALSTIFARVALGILGTTSRGHPDESDCRDEHD
jgi:hypothetical protein